MTAPRPLFDRIDDRIRVDPVTGCWIFSGALTSGGHGRIWFNGTRLRVHRVMYERYRGPIPGGAPLGWVCPNQACCNPAHLEPLARHVNSQATRLYEHFRQNPAQVVEASRLIDLFWGYDPDGGPTWAVARVNVLIHELRTILSTRSDERLRTVYGIGYAYETGTCTLPALNEFVCGEQFFTRKESDLMRLLLRHKRVSYEQARQALWDDGRTDYLGNFVLFLRRKLEPIGYTINVIRGEAMELARIEERREADGGYERGGLAAECAAWQVEEAEPLMAEHRHIEDRISELEAENAELKDRVDSQAAGIDVLAHVLLAMHAGDPIAPHVERIKSVIMGEEASPG